MLFVRSTDELIKKVLIQTLVNYRNNGKSRFVTDDLILKSSSVAERARVLDVSECKSGIWLKSLPLSNVGTTLNDSTFRLAARLRLGFGVFLCIAVTPVKPSMVSNTTSAGRIPRHAQFNYVIRRTIFTSSVPAIL